MLCAWSITPIQPAAALCVRRPNIDPRPSPSLRRAGEGGWESEEENEKVRENGDRVVMSNWEKQKGKQTMDLKPDFRNNSQGKLWTKILLKKKKKEACMDASAASYTPSPNPDYSTLVSHDALLCDK